MTNVSIFSWKGVACVLLLMGIGVGLYIYTKDAGVPKPPLHFPLSLEQVGNKIETNVRIRDRDSYYFSLRFSYKEKDEGDRARVRILTGDNETDNYGKALQPGVPTPVILRVSALDAGQEKEMYVKEIDPVLTSWGGNSFEKIIGSVRLEPGLYKVEFENLRSSPEFNGTPVTFTITGSGFY